MLFRLAYRDSSRARRVLLGGVIVSTVLAAGFGLYAVFWRYHLKRLQTVREGALYRCAQPTEFGLRHLVDDLGVRTVVSLQLFDYRLYHGIFDPAGPSGVKEAEYVEGLGARMVQWPMGEEAYWPWPTPWQFEAFFKLFDDPANLPVAIHCMGGRHRTGTVAAMYRIEYDRWSADDAIAEMRSFDFPDHANVQEHNLRTYTPRPRPAPELWAELEPAFGPLVGSPPAEDYESLVRQLRNLDDRAELRETLIDWLEEGRAFGLPLAQRLIDDENDTLVEPACDAAMRALVSAEASLVDWRMAAAIVADFGSEDQQQQLLAMIVDERKSQTISPRYAAIIEGVTNRYTRNRIAYVTPLLDDERLRPEPAARGIRYCDTAVAFLQSIVDVDFLTCHNEPGIWERGREAARRWLDTNEQVTALRRSAPPDGEKSVRAGDGTQQEDLSRLH